MVLLLTFVNLLSNRTVTMLSTARACKIKRSRKKKQLLFTVTMSRSFTYLYNPRAQTTCDIHRCHVYADLYRDVE